MFQNIIKRKDQSKSSNSITYTKKSMGMNSSKMYIVEGELPQGDGELMYLNSSASNDTHKYSFKTNTSKIEFSTKQLILNTGDC